MQRQELKHIRPLKWKANENPIWYGIMPADTFPVQSQVWKNFTLTLWFSLIGAVAVGIILESVIQGMIAGFVMLYIVAKASRSLKTRSTQGVDFIVTDQRLIFIQERNVKSIPLHKLNKLTLRANGLSIESEWYSGRTTPTIDLPGITEEEAIVIERAIRQNGKFKALDETLSQIAEENDLTCETMALTDENNLCRLFGELNGGHLDLDLQSIAPHKSEISATLNLGNPYDFYLEITKKTTVNSLGASDLKLGYPIFDNTFLIKTNTPEIAKKILSPEVRQLITQACTNANSPSLKIGEYKAALPTPRSQKTRDDANVLDLHLIVDDGKTAGVTHEYPTQHDPDRRSDLVFTGTYSKASQHMSKPLGSVVELLKKLEQSRYASQAV